MLLFSIESKENNLDSTSFKGVFINDSPLRENVITGKLKECTEYEVRLQNIYKAGFETITDELLSHEKTVCESGLLNHLWIYNACKNCLFRF